MHLVIQHTVGCLHSHVYVAFRYPKTELHDVYWIRFGDIDIESGMDMKLQTLAWLNIGVNATLLITRSNLPF